MRILFFPILLASVLSVPVPQTKDSLYLDRTEYVLADTAKSEAFHLHLINTSDSIAVIEEVRPSCGCVMATPQWTVATKEKNGDIYVGVVNDHISPTQPITIDVYTNRNRQKPLRLYIRKKTAEAPAWNRQK